MPLELLLVEDEPALLLSLGDALEEAGHRVTRCSDGARAAQVLAVRDLDVLVTDVRLPGLSGCELARRALERRPPLAVLLMTAYGDVGQAVEMLKLGARDYLTKPLHEQVLVDRLAAMERESAVRPGARDDDPVAVSPAMAAVLSLVRKVAPTEAAVVLLGETGSGKEVVARMVHRLSRRSTGPFVALNCAALPAELVESELFGHERGAFTGAQAPRRGWLRAAQGGTLLLDEIGDLPAPAQAKLLRVIETREVAPIGGDRAEQVDFRLLAATHCDLGGDARDGSFRQDLFYRLGAFEIHVPPLRERVEDLAPLVGRFLDDLRSRAPEVPVGVTDEALAVLAAHPWPGNVRELKNVVEHAAIMAGGDLVRPAHLPPRLGRKGSAPGSPLDLRRVMDRVEADQVRRALAVADGRRTRAAELLGISRKHLWELSRRHGIDVGGA